MKFFLMGLAVAATAMTFANSAQAECGDVSVAEMNWASAELVANIDKIILEKGYDCNVELVPGATVTTFASMNEKGQPDVAGELWTNSFAAPLEAAIAEGRIHAVNAAPITGLGDGWWVGPKTAAAYPEITKDINALLTRPDLFPHPEDPTKGAFVGCPAGWACQLANVSLFRAFEMEKKGWLLIDPGSAAGLDGSMAKAIERGENWLGYYWAPTALIGKYGMVSVDLGPWGGLDNWNNCIVAECDNPKPSSWTHARVNTVVTDRFKKAGGVAVDYLAGRVFPGEVMNDMLVYMQENQASGADAAYTFLAEHEALWRSWVSADAAAKIKASM